jgi:Uma2 family endonuclease
MLNSTEKARKAQPQKTTAREEVITFDQFFEMVDENVKADLVDGRIIYEPPATPRQGLIVTRIISLIGFYAEMFDLGEVFGAKVAVKLAKYQGPEPDVFFISKHRHGIVGELYVDGPPDLCVEVISESSRQLDRERKFVLYADHGVKEYWIVDPLQNTIEFYENQDGELIKIMPDNQGRLHSKVLPGFWLKSDWLAADPLPPVLKTLRDILGEDHRLIS